MGGMIIWLIIIAIVIAKTQKKNKKPSAKPNVPRPKERPMKGWIAQEQLAAARKKEAQEAERQRAREEAERRRVQEAEAVRKRQEARKQELKRKQEEKLAAARKAEKPSPGAGRNVETVNDEGTVATILNNARITAEESDPVRQEDVLAKVRDLMILGPDVELTFERDFVSEGMDMLNRIQGI